MRVKLQPASSSKLPAFSPLTPPAVISQMLLLDNPHKVCSGNFDSRGMGGPSTVGRQRGRLQEVYLGLALKYVVGSGGGLFLAESVFFRAHWKICDWVAIAGN